MKITDKNYNDIVDGVYNVDAGKVKRPWRDDKIFKSNGQTFRVLKTQDNTSNGMQVLPDAIHSHQKDQVIVRAGQEFTSTTTYHTITK